MSIYRLEDWLTLIRLTKHIFVNRWNSLSRIEGSNLSIQGLNGPFHG